MAQTMLSHDTSAPRHGIGRVVLIAGPTASGKSALACALAEDFGGTIINADSLQVYRDLRILTARPDEAAERRAPHRLYGYLDASERGSVAAWRDAALREIAAAHAVGSLPLVVGGTGLYLRALRDGLADIPQIPPEIRAEAVALHADIGPAAFHAALRTLDPAAAARLAPGDSQRLIRAYETMLATGTPIGVWQAAPKAAAPHRFATLLLAPPRAALYATCDARLKGMLQEGALEEVGLLAARRLAPDLPAMKAVGVPEFTRHLIDGQPLSDMLVAAQQSTRRYVKRQTTWFRHQLRPDLTLNEQYSESLMPSLRQFMQWFLLTPLA